MNVPPKNQARPMPNNRPTPMTGNRPGQPNMRPMPRTGQPGAVHPQQPAGNRPAQQNMRPMPRTGQPGAVRPQQPAGNRPAQPAMRPMPQNTAATRPAPQSAVRQAYPQQQQQQPSAETPITHAPKSPYEPNFASDFNLPPALIKTKGYLLTTLLILIIGFVFGSLTSGSTSSAPQVIGLQGVVRNRDITQKMARCGQTERGQACLLYIMNSSRYDKIAEDFFEEAVKLMGVQEYSISMVNPKYAKERIPPGYFAEIKIPNVR